MPVLKSDGELWERLRDAYRLLDQASEKLLSVIEPPIADVTIEPQGDPGSRVVMVRVDEECYRLAEIMAADVGEKLSQVFGTLVRAGCLDYVRFTKERLGDNGDD